MTMHRICTAALCSILSCYSLAQTSQTEAKTLPQTDVKPGRGLQCPAATTENVRVFHLKNATQVSDANEVYTALRQILAPDVKTFFVPNQLAIEICAQPDQLALTQRMIADLDRPKQNYRLSYTVTEMDGTTKASTHHYSMLVTPGQEATLKQGSRVPIVSSSNTVSYVDVGVNFSATIDSMAQGIRLRTTIEQSSVAEPRPTEGPQNPVIRQATFRGTSIFSLGSH